jgi:hypothetical protein
MQRAIFVLWLVLWIALLGGCLFAREAWADVPTKTPPEGTPKVLADKLAKEDRMALAYALFPMEEYRNGVPLSPTFDVRAEVEHCHTLFQSSAFLETADCYALVFVARPDLLQTLFNIAQALRRAGKPETALAFYRRFLSAHPTTPLRAEVEGYVRELSALLSANTLLKPLPPPPHKRAWFWVTISSAVVVTTAVVLGVTFGLRQTTPTPPPQEEILGPIDVILRR